MPTGISVLLISTYELGRQPFGLASPAAWLGGAGHRVRCLDLSVEPFAEQAAAGAQLVCFFLPMHTATRIAASAIARVRAANPGAHLCAYGLYGPPNAGWLGALGVGTVLGGEVEEELLALADALAAGRAQPPQSEVSLGRLAFRVPERAGLPPLTKYAHLTLPDGTRKVVGATEASRGCKHRCRHCPVVPIYKGAFRLVQPEIVLADVRQLEAAGARHIAFGDPDFFNAAAHGMAVARALHDEFPRLTYDVTIKIEHLLKHADLLDELQSTGCAFVTTAAESVDDEILRILDKGHKAADLESVVSLCRRAGLPLSPTFVPFTPWTTLEGYARLLASLAELDLIGSVSPVQLSIRLLVPAGSYLLDFPEARGRIGAFDPAVLSHRWESPDPRVDALQAEVAGLAEAAADASREETFARIWNAAQRALGREGAPIPTPRTSGPVPPLPVMSEPWYCCAEPTQEQLVAV